MSRVLKHLTAPCVIPVAGPPIENGAVVWSGDSIAWTGRATELPKDAGNCEADFGPGVAVLPGLVNAHTHLWLTGLRGKIEPTPDFIEWMRKLIPEAQKCAYSDNKEVILDGLRQSLQAGTTLVGDYVRTTGHSDALIGQPVRVVNFIEALGFGRFLSFPLLWFYLRKMRRFPLHDRVGRGFAPHAPYSAGPTLTKLLSWFARRHGVPFSGHLAETKEEHQFLKDGSGPWREIAEERGFNLRSLKAPGCGPVEYYERLGVLRDMVAVHVCYPEEGGLERLAENNVIAVKCPTTDRWLSRNDSTPIRDFLDKGIRVALGTDSLASSDTLDMFQVMAMVREDDPGLAPEAVLRMATVNGAHALGYADRLGELAPGRLADMAAVRVGEMDPLEAITSGKCSVERVWIEGENVL